MKQKFIAPFAAALLVCALSVTALADTIRLKDGSVLRGQVVGFKDQQFTILVGAGARGGRRSRITIYMEDIESIEFDSEVAGNGVPSAGGSDADAGNTTAPAQPATQPRTTTTNTGRVPRQPDADAGDTTTAPARTNAFFQVQARVRGDNTNNGWTNSGLVVRRGQRLRISATGRVALGAGRSSTPAGLPTMPDREKLMRDQPTGGLIAVIGDDNDEFIFLGRSREFTAQRDGVLFLGVNEGNLGDNTGTYEVTIEAEAGGTR